MERELHSTRMPGETDSPRPSQATPDRTSPPPGFAECLSVVKAMPEVFGKSAERALLQDLSDPGTHHLYLLKEGDDVAGFALVFSKSEDVVELAWLAVDPKFRKKGVGRRLIDKISKELASHAPAPPRILMIRCLKDASRPAEGVGARSFFQKTGFLLVDTIETSLPGEPSFPCDIFVKVLSD